MAPIPLDTVDNRLKDVIQDLFEIQSSVHGYLGPETQQVLVRKVTQLSDSLAALSNTASSTSARAPPELIHQFIDDGRNPDIYTREFIEQIQLLNREMKGKCEAFASFGAILGAEMTKAMPTLEDDVARILSAGSAESASNGNGQSTGS
ncbi:MAG: RNA polymerase II mediator complex subunit [Heterodermia speciosa]|uniref:Mediator of RNA polymerase II transcription subunit 10 n=1 Tax=Heterodermia speciosa TaxID=116794 RepID=A0A8H3EP47_9LECA|nr:MAG: RNA polymerase II mediator complex subunit [Heterodermia speciosa]